MTTTCRFCQKPLFLNADPACPQVLVEHIAKMVTCCGRCGDYHFKQLLIREALSKLALRHRMPGENKEKLRTRITNLGKQYMTALCHYYHVQPYWEDSIVDDWIQKPNQIEVSLNAIEHAAKKTIKTEPHPVTNDP